MTPAKKRESEDLPISRGLVKWLDDYYLDGIIGFFVPGAGDVVTGMGSMTLIVAALRERVPTVILVRMLLNIVVDVVFGAIPILGDIFDLFWRSNRRNLALIEKYRGGKEKPSGGDYVIAFFGLVLAALAMVVPILWIYGTYTALSGLFGG